jgi:two-component system response regulator FlrC
MEAAEFREDLFYRFNTFTIAAPLRERARHPGVATTSAGGGQGQQEGGPALTGSAGPAQALPWLGNLRELENVIERAGRARLDAPGGGRTPPLYMQEGSQFA